MPDGDSWYSTTKYDYNQFGKLTMMIDPFNKSGRGCHITDYEKDWDKICILTEKGISKSQINEKNHIQIRKELVCGLRDKSNLSIRQIADILGINRGVVQRIID